MKKLLLICLCFIAWSSSRSQTFDTLSHFGSAWKYYDSTFNIDSATWNTAAYNDANWSCGPTPIGYGDTWILTCIHSGCGGTDCYPSCATKNITAWFRQKINVTNIANYDEVDVSAIADDGFIMYVNGVNVWSQNMPTTFNSSTWASSTISGGAETTQVTNVIPISNFINGTNVVAIELHQRGPTSSDLTWDGQFLFKHHTSAVKNYGSKLIATVYPNPSKDIFNFETDAAFNGECSLTIYDISGRTINHETMVFNNGKSQWHCNLVPGTYNARIVSPDFNFSTPIIVQ